MPSGIFYACCATKAGVPRRAFWRPVGRISASVPQSTWTSYLSRFDAMGLVGILVSLALLIWLSFRGWSVLLLAPAVALLAAALAGEPLLAHWTQTFMGSAAGFIAQFFPIFILGALFGKLMDDSGSVQTIAHFMSTKIRHQRAILAVVLAGALVTYGGVSLFVAFFVLAPMARALFHAAHKRKRIIPGAIAFSGRQYTAAANAGSDRSRNLDLHDVGNAGNAGHSEHDSDAVFRHHA